MDYLILRFHLYADDTVIYYPESTFMHLIALFNSLLKILLYTDDDTIYYFPQQAINLIYFHTFKGSVFNMYISSCTANIESCLLYTYNVCSKAYSTTFFEAPDLNKFKCQGPK